MKEKALRFCDTLYASVDPVWRNALWAASFMSQFGTGRINRKIERKNCRNLWLKGTMHSSGPSFAHIGLFPTVYQSTSTLNSHSWNEEEASDVNRRGWDPSRTNWWLTVIQGSRRPESHYLQLDYCTLGWRGFPSLFALSLCSLREEHGHVSLFQFLKYTRIFISAWSCQIVLLIQGYSSWRD